ncbi:MAG: hypothetical protein K6A64_00020 [Bacteroidales bacterium]|nr:hypothetical protein [Bacteroidales bacterium]
MRKASLLVLALLLALSAAVAQDLRTGVMHPYPGNAAVETPPPTGYKAFYISHFGRHGSRYLSYEKVILPALQPLAAAEQEGLLTPEGEYLLEKVRELHSESAGMWGQLSKFGVMEHQGIARRMVARYPTVFKDSVRVMSSIYPRCIVSMSASTGEIARLAPRTKWSYLVGKRYQSIVNTSHRPEGWISGASQQKKYLIENLDMDSMLEIIFSDPVRGKEIVGNQVSFAKAIFNAWADREAIGLEPFSLDGIIGVEAVNVLAASESLAGYKNMAIPNADSLITDIVLRADAAIKRDKPSADLRYGHDNGLMRLLVQIGIEGYSADLDNDSAASFCFGEKVPLAANLQIVFYRNKKGKVLVKFLVNEQEGSLAALSGGPYYKWEEVRALLEQFCLE